MATDGGSMSGAVDPETLYTKQNCIGRPTDPFVNIGSNSHI